MSVGVMFGIGMAGADPAVVAQVGWLYLYLSPLALVVALVLDREPPEAKAAVVFLRDEGAR